MKISFVLTATICSLVCNSLVHIAMRKREIPHEFRIRDGGHKWTYWRESLPEVLEFVSQASHQN